MIHREKGKEIETGKKEREMLYKLRSFVRNLLHKTITYYIMTHSGMMWK